MIGGKKRGEELPVAPMIRTLIVVVAGGMERGRKD